MDSSILPISMVEKLRNLLRQESEHQWLSLFVFFLFVLAGAYAISVTSHYSGGAIDESEHSFSGHQVLDVVYTNNGDVVTHTYKEEFGYALMWETSDGQSELLLNPNNIGDSTHLSFLKELNDGSVAFSARENTVSFATENAVENLDFSDDIDVDFAIVDVQIESSGHMLMLVYEDGEKTVRGLSDSQTLTNPMVVSSQDDWISIEHLRADIWVLTGMHLASGISNPNSPTTYMSVGFVEWDGSSSTPVLFSKQTFDDGQIHTVHVLSNGSIVAAGTSDVLIIEDVNEISTFQLSSATSISNGATVWFFNDIETKQVALLSDDGLLMKQLSMKLPLQPTVSGFSDEMIYIHGQDQFGEQMVFSFDTSLDGSLQSGRGFLNAGFIFVCSIIFGVMFWNIALIWKKY
jgi:hypothetical protein